MSVMSDEPLAMPFDSKMRWIEADDVDSVSDSEDTAETLILDGGDDEVTKQYREYANKCAAEEKARYEAYKVKKEAEEKTRYTAETSILDDELTEQYREYAIECVAEEKTGYARYSTKKEAEEKTRLAQAAPSQKVMPILSVRK
jgi:hypothetical protein